MKTTFSGEYHPQFHEHKAIIFDDGHVWRYNYRSFGFLRGYVNVIVLMVASIYYTYMILAIFYYPHNWGLFYEINTTLHEVNNFMKSNFHSLNTDTRTLTKLGYGSFYIIYGIHLRIVFLLFSIFYILFAFLSCVFPIEINHHTFNIKKITLVEYMYREVILFDYLIIRKKFKYGKRTLHISIISVLGFFLIFFAESYGYSSRLPALYPDSTTLLSLYFLFAYPALLLGIHGSIIFVISYAMFAIKLFTIRNVRVNVIDVTGNESWLSKIQLNKEEMNEIISRQ